MDIPDENFDLGALCPGVGVPFSDLGGSKRLFFLADWPEFLTRFLLLMTSVFRLMGRGRLCSLRKSPQALHNTDPASSLLHKGVVEVVQFWQIGGVVP